MEFMEFIFHIQGDDKRLHTHFCFFPQLLGFNIKSKESEEVHNAEWIKKMWEERDIMRRYTIHLTDKGDNSNCSIEAEQEKAPKLKPQVRVLVWRLSWHFTTNIFSRMCLCFY